MMMNNSKKCYLVPPDEQRCVWMAAGQLSYQLCDRMFECDDCPVDAAMHRRSPVLEAEGVDSQFAPQGLPDIPQESFHYSRNHWWSRKSDPGHFRLGIEAGLAQALLPVKGVVFPSPRQHLRAGQVCIWVVMDGGTLALEAPLDGVVLAVNRELIDKPHLLCLQPFDEGWLCELEPDDIDAAAAELMTAEQARSKYAIDRNRLVASLASSFRGKRPAAGLTLADGGVRLQNLADIFGPARYVAQLRHYFGWAKK